MKSFLFVLQTDADQGVKVQELLDQVLITAAFDQHVSLLLLDGAVYHLLKNQLGAEIACKEIALIYRSLELYDIQSIYVEQESLIAQGLTTDELLIPVTLVNRNEVALTLKSFDFVISA